MKGGGEMDHRTALKQDTLLRFSNKSGEVFRYLIIVFVMLLDFLELNTVIILWMHGVYIQLMRENS